MREVIDIQRRVLGPEHPDTVRSVGVLAWNLKTQGHYAEAEKLLREVLDIERRVLGPEHRHTLDAMNDVAATLAREGRYAEAEKLARQTLDIERRVLGPDNEATGVSLYNLACWAARQGHKNEAISLLNDSVNHGLPAKSSRTIDADTDFSSLHGDPRFTALVAHAKEVAQSKSAAAQK